MFGKHFSQGIARPARPGRPEFSRPSMRSRGCSKSGAVGPLWAERRSRSHKEETHQGFWRSRGCNDAWWHGLLSMQKQQQQQQLMHTTKTQADAARGHAHLVSVSARKGREVWRSCLLPCAVVVHGRLLRTTKWASKVVTGEIHPQGKWIS